MTGLKQAFGSTLFDTRFPVELQILAPGDRVILGPETTLSVAKTPHTVESLAVRIDSLGGSVCYTGDTGYCEELASFFSETNALISECSFRARREGVAHLSIEDAAKLAAKAKAERLVVTHFYFEVNDDELELELEQGYGGEVLIGRDGLSIVF
jgi:ribonuclease BN (tRNA processing enzyme)